MKKLGWWETIERTRTTIPNEELDHDYVLGRFQNIKDAKKLAEEKQKELFVKLQANPRHPYTHMEYFVRWQTVNLK